jgi:hypothetical protein
MGANYFIEREVANHRGVRDEIKSQNSAVFMGCEPYFGNLEHGQNY